MKPATELLIEISEENAAQPEAFYDPEDSRFYGSADYKIDLKNFNFHKVSGGVAEYFVTQQNFLN